MPLIYPKTSFHQAAVLGDIRYDAVDIIANADAIGYSALVAVLHNQVLVEEAQGLLGWSGGETNDEGIEILEHLSPKMIDGAMSLVGYYEVEGFYGDGGVIGYFLCGKNCW